MRLTLHTVPVLLFGAVSLLGLSGCAGSPARVITDDRDRITTVDRIDINDWANAAGDLIGKLNTSGALERSAVKPAPIQVSQIINSTASNIDTDLLMNKILTELNRTGKASAFTKDRGAREESEYQKFMKNAKEIVPAFVLSGKIIQDKTRAGSIRESSFVFQLVLTDASTGLNAWQDEKIITKQGDKPSVRF